MRVFEILLGLASVLACSAAVQPAHAQGSPKTIDTRGLEKVRWYKAPLQIQILPGPKVTEFGGGSAASGVYAAGPGSNISGLNGPTGLPQAGFQSNIIGGAPATPPAPPMVQSPVSLPQAQFRSNVPVRQISQGNDLPSGASTNLMGKLIKPQQWPANVAQASPRHHLLSQPTGHGARHLANPSNPNVQQLVRGPTEPAPAVQTIKRYADYPTAAGSAYGGSKVSTSVSGKIRRGSLLTDR